jgi:hypothetical protein
MNKEPSRSAEHMVSDLDVQGAGDGVKLDGNVKCR